VVDQVEILADQQVVVKVEVEQEDTELQLMDLLR